MTEHRVHTLAAGELVAAFRPEHGMLGISLKHRGEEILRLLDDLDEAAATGRSVGIPLLHPWANRLDGPRYAAAGKSVTLDPESPWLMRDWNQVIVHGVPWSKLEWRMIEGTDTVLASRLSWDRPELLAVFPYTHEVGIRATLDATGLTIETTVTATGDSPVPVSFGYHPQLGLPGLPRTEWLLDLPPMELIVLDERLLPTGTREPYPKVDRPLADTAFDHGFAFTTPSPTMSISGGGRRISVDFLSGYRYAQIYAPPAIDYISLEPMVAPTNALVTGEDLPVVKPGKRYVAVFRIGVESTD